MNRKVSYGASREAACNAQEPGTIEMAVSDGRVRLAGKVTVARGFWQRLVGLMGRAPSRMAPDECLVIPQCAAVHTCFMRFPIDVVFVDASGRVLKVVESLPPYRAASARGAMATVELAAGASRRLGIRPGSVLESETTVLLEVFREPAVR